MSKPINLKFFGPYPLASDQKDILADSPYENENGIYLWTVKMRNGTYKIFYVGETKRSFYLRMKEHLIQQLGGNYRIYNPDLLKKGNLDLVWEGLWGKRKNKLPEFLKRHVDLALINLEFIFCQSLFIAPLNIDMNLQKHIEGAIVNEVRKSGNASSILPEGIKYYNPTETNIGVNIKISSDEVIYGLPEELIL